MIFHLCLLCEALRIGKMMKIQQQEISNKNIPWRDVVTRYQNPSVWRSTWQLINSIGPYLILWFLMWQFEYQLLADTGSVYPGSRLYGTYLYYLP